MMNINHLDPVIEQVLRVVHESCDWPADEPDPASEEEIAAAERELGIVFPESYRAFLRAFGAGNLHSHEFYGLPSTTLRGNVVMMNQLCPQPADCLQITEDVGDAFYCLDTSRRDARGECPVVICDNGRAPSVVAESFLEFLRKAKAGLL
ncbi:MAG: SMI1/KNR4 family protein [Gemmataceae bacterium]|nr:SMI1/KNR4 family protein [Gemmataceae bacterium]